MFHYISTIDTICMCMYTCILQNLFFATCGKGSFWRHLQSVSGRDPKEEQGKSEEEEASKPVCDEPATSHFSCPPVPLVGKR